LSTIPVVTSTPSSSASTTALRRAQVVGTGLIGGSVARALRDRGWHVTGRDVEESHARRARELGVIDEVGVDTDAELTVVAVPPAALVTEVRRALADSSGVVTDTGSVKSAVAGAIDDPRFVAGHPMAGSEQDGVDGADPSIFEGAVWVLTPHPETADDALQTLQVVLTSLGADVVTMTPERHDRLVAVVSHVPHLTAATMMALADDRALDDSPLLRLAAGGFRDMTRIAAGHPGIWLDICSENRIAILQVLDELRDRLYVMREIVERGDRDGLRALLSQARAARTNLPDRNVRPQDLIEVRVPIPDRKGQIAAITMLAADCDVNVADIEVAHSPEGARGVLVLVVARAEVQRFLAALAGQGYHPSTRELG
jgi:prephenate dehydrogenase